MNIDPLSTNSQFISSFRRHTAFNEEPGTAKTEAGWDQVATDRSTGLRDSLASLAEVRPEVVKRGRQLLQDPNYPGADIIAKIASLITPLPED